MNGLVDDIIRRRRENPAAMAESRDLLSAMLTGVDSVTGGRISDTNARYQAITFLVAGHESTSALLTFTLHLLVQHPQFLARAYEEVDRVLGTDARCAKADTILGGKYLVRARQPILLNVFALQRDKEAWGEDADRLPSERAAATNLGGRDVTDSKWSVVSQPLTGDIFRNPTGIGDDQPILSPASVQCCRILHPKSFPLLFSSNIPPHCACSPSCA